MNSDIALESRSTLCWFAVQTLPRHEKRVHQRLEYSGVHCFLPLYASWNRWKNGCKVRVEFPLFPSYLFIELSKRECGRILLDPGVTRVIGMGREPVAIPENEIQALQQATLLGKLKPHDYLTVGEKVRIKTGPLAELTGILVRKDSDFRVVLQLDLIRRGVSVEVDLDDVEPVAATLS